MNALKFLAGIPLILAATLSWGDSKPVKTFASEAKASQVVEIFTSEGCSSCPPADKWLSTFKKDPDLFKTLVPLAFHVDYWDWLGWKDRFGSKEYTQRQRDYVKSDQLSQAYTPGILVNSQEFRQWFRGARKLPNNSGKPGILSADLSKDNTLTINFKTNEPLVANVAILGMGITSTIKRGENTGKTLLHDFVVLNVDKKLGKGQWQFKLPDLKTLETGKQPALAIWLSEQDSPVIIQATGGYL